MNETHDTGTMIAEDDAEADRFTQERKKAEKRAPNKRAKALAELDARSKAEPWTRHTTTTVLWRAGCDACLQQAELVELIEVGKRLRPLDETRVVELMDSIRECGLLQPIVIAAAFGDDDVSLHLVAGAHRLEAVKRLGWYYVPVIYFDGNAIDTALAEIDENLVRNALSQAEIAKHMARRQELFERKGGASRITLGGEQRIGFAKDTAEKTGHDKSTINRATRRGKQIAGDVLDNITENRPDLNTGVALDKLAAMPVGQQREVIAGMRPLSATPVRQRNVEAPTADDAVPEEMRQGAAEAAPASVAAPVNVEPATIETSAAETAPATMTHTDAYIIDKAATLLIQGLGSDLYRLLLLWPAVAKEIAAALGSSSPERAEPKREAA